MTGPDRIAAIAIGRNEGERLVRCLASLRGRVARIVYVDSGSTDGSLAAARAAGAEIVELETTLPFTAARARNAGFDRLRRGTPPLYVQFVDGDCTLDPDWLETAAAFLDARPEVAVVCGRRRERHPEASVYNALIDLEWDRPVGEVPACGGDALMRRAVLEAVGGYNPNLIAGEEPELCVRMRKAGWTIWRLGVEMTLHDAEMTRLSQWWKRATRAGHAYAEGAALHGAPPFRHNVAQVRRALAWGLGVPLAVLILSLLSPWGLLLLLLYPLQVLRVARQGRGWTHAAFVTLAKFPETQGILTYGWNRLRGARAGLMEYK